MNRGVSPTAKLQALNARGDAERTPGPRLPRWRGSTLACIQLFLKVEFYGLGYGFRLRGSRVKGRGKCVHRRSIVL